MRLLLTILCTLQFSTVFFFGQTETEPSPAATTGDYEELPVLSAAEILQPAILEGPHHKIRDQVIPSSGANHFMIESDYGVFEADGNEMLIKRVDEISAIAKLKEVSRTEEFKNALVKAAKSPLASAKAIVTDPVRAISNVPKGISKFMGRVGSSVKNIGKRE
jgi:hypothetical protein